jgi:hypothetical protein
MRLWPWRQEWTAADRVAILEDHALDEADEAAAARQRVLDESHRWDDQTAIYPIITYGQEHGYRLPGSPQ